MREKSAMVLHMYTAFLVVIIFLSCIVLSFFNDQYAVAFTFILIGFIFSTGISIVQPNEAVVIKLMGKYVGSVREVGLFMTLPFAGKNKVSLKIQTSKEFEMEVNIEDRTIKLHPIVVYRVVDSAKAIFEVDDYIDFIDSQVGLTMNLLMDDEIVDNFKNEENGPKKSINILQKKLALNMQKRLELVGIELIEVQILI